MTPLVGRAWWLPDLELPAGLVPWAALLWPIVIGAIVLVGLAAVAAGGARWGRTRLAIWRVTLVLLVLLPVAEVSGLTAWLTPRVRGTAPAPLADVVEESSRYGLLTTRAGRPVQPALWPLVIWLIGFTVVLGRRAVGSAALVRFRRRLRTPAPADLVVRVATVGRRCGYRRLVRVRVVAGLRSPLVFGVRRPILAVPPDFADAFTPAQQEAVIAHELGHLAHRDPLWQWVSAAAGAVGWWNPVVWWARARHRAAAEAAADEFTTRVHDGPGLLAECLVLFGRRVAAPNLAGSLAADGGLRSGLAVRVRRLLSLDSTAPGRRGRLAKLLTGGLGVVLLLAALGGTAWARPATAGRPLWAAWTGEPEVTPESPALWTAEQVKALEIYVICVDDGRTDQDALSRLGLTADQWARFRRLRAEIDADTLELYQMRTGHRERGLEINRKWTGGLQEILTPEQYRKYQAYWTGDPVVVTPVKAVPVRKMAGPAAPGGRGRVAAGG